MKETGLLKVIGDRSFSEKTIVINPNDGFDLGLLMTEATVVVHQGDSLDALEDPNAETLYARIYQKNECKLGTIELSLKTVEKLGNPKHVRIHMNDGSPYPKVFISTE
jgi:hypothetical protein